MPSEADESSGGGWCERGKEAKDQSGPTAAPTTTVLREETKKWTGAVQQTKHCKDIFGVIFHVLLKKM